MRGYGIPQAMFAMESHTDDVARAMGVPPYEFRMKNVMPKGFKDGFSKNVNYYDTFRECMEKGRKEFDYDGRLAKYSHQTGGYPPRSRNVCILVQHWCMAHLP